MNIECQMLCKHDYFTKQVGNIWMHRNKVSCGKKKGLTSITKTLYGCILLSSKIEANTLLLTTKAQKLNRKTM